MNRWEVAILAFPFILAACLYEIARACRAIDEAQAYLDAGCDD